MSESLISNSIVIRFYITQAGARKPKDVFACMCLCSDTFHCTRGCKRKASNLSLRTVNAASASWALFRPTHFFRVGMSCHVLYLWLE